MKMKTTKMRNRKWTEMMMNKYIPKRVYSMHDFALPMGSLSSYLEPCRVKSRGCN